MVIVNRMKVAANRSMVEPGRVYFSTGTGELYMCTTLDVNKMNGDIYFTNLKSGALFRSAYGDSIPHGFVEVDSTLTFSDKE